MDWTHLHLYTKDYKAQPGDTLKSISAKFKVNVNELAEINNIHNITKRLSSGQLILIPVDHSKEALSLKIPATSIGRSTFFRTNSYDQGSQELPHDDEEIIEKKLVKLDVHRVILDHFECWVSIPGILVITPSMLLFDPVQLESNLVSEFGIAFPLCSIHSMKTYSDLTDIDSILKGSLVKHLSEKSSIIAALNRIKISSKNLLTKTHDERPREETTAVDNPALSGTGAPDFCSYASIDDHSSILPNSEDMNVYLILRAKKLGPSSSKQSPEPSPTDSYVNCALSIHKSKIDEVFSFLLHAGVGMVESPMSKPDRAIAPDFRSNVNDARPTGKFPSDSPDAFSSIDSFPREFKDENFSICIVGDVHDDSVGETKSRSCHTFYWDDNKSDFVASTWVMLEIPETCDHKNEKSQSNKERSVIGEALDELGIESFQPELRHGSSDIMTDGMVEDVAKSLPTNLSCAHFLLIFKSSRDGFCLRTIYRKMEVVQSPVLLLIKDTNNNIFGAFLSERMMISQYFYGRGDSYVFHWKPQFQAYRWTQNNNFFMKGNPDSFMIGSTNGKNAIWFDSLLKNGYSGSTDTFNNPGLVVSANEKPSDFIIDTIETWGFVS